MHDITFRNVFLGFLAASLAVLTVHQLVFWFLSSAGVVSYAPWSLLPTRPWGVPAIINNTFWGGLWGALFALVWRQVSGSTLAVKGALFGVLGPLLAGRWVLVPLITGDPLFANLNLAAMLASFLAIAAFGAALGWLYGRFTGLER